MKLKTRLTQTRSLFRPTSFNPFNVFNLRPSLCALLFLSTLNSQLSTLFAQVPQLLHYQGRAIVSNTPFEGTGQFKFALVSQLTSPWRQATATATISAGHINTITVTDGGTGYTSEPQVYVSGGGGGGTIVGAIVSGGQVVGFDIFSPGAGYTSAPTITMDPPPPPIVSTSTLWSNDGSGTAGGMPAAAVSLPVSKGLYALLLGDTNLPNMTAIPASTFANNSDVRLRVWFNGGLGFQLVSPDQRIAAVGYAMTAASVDDGAITTEKIAAGAITAAKLAPNATGWGLAGNSGTTPADFVGTTDNQPLELKVNGARVLRLEPGSSPNVVGGYSGNVVSSGVVGATISGGGALYGTNRVGAALATIGGGAGSTASGEFATVSGGDQNTASGYRTTIGGGGLHTASGSAGTVGGGVANTASGIAGTASGGLDNVASGSRATVPGGEENTASGDYSFAAGHQAKAQHAGAFVWADSTAADFPSVANDEFAIRAANGVRVVGGGVTASSFSGPVTFPDGSTQYRATDSRPLVTSGLPAGSTFTVTIDGTAAMFRGSYSIVHPAFLSEGEYASSSLIEAREIFFLQRPRTSDPTWYNWYLTNNSSAYHRALLMTLAVPGGATATWSGTVVVASFHLVNENGATWEQLRVMSSQLALLTRSVNGSPAVNSPSTPFADMQVSLAGTLQGNVGVLPDFEIRDTVTSSGTLSGFAGSRLGLRANPFSGAAAYSAASTSVAPSCNIQSAGVDLVTVPHAYVTKYTLRLADDGLPIEEYELVFNRP